MVVDAWVPPRNWSQGGSLTHSFSLFLSFSISFFSCRFVSFLCFVLSCLSFCAPNRPNLPTIQALSVLVHVRCCACCTGRSWTIIQLPVLRQLLSVPELPLDALGFDGTLLLVPAERMTDVKADRLRWRCFLTELHGSRAQSCKACCRSCSQSPLAQGHEEHSNGRFRPCQSCPSQCTFLPLHGEVGTTNAAVYSAKQARKHRQLCVPHGNGDRPGNEGMSRWRKKDMKKKVNIYAYILNNK